MQKNYLSIIAAGVCLVFLAGCAAKNDNQLPAKTEVQNKTETQVPEKSGAIQTTETEAGLCQEESVKLANYGDPGHQLKNCFVEYPGEPSRQDKSYYIVEDICGQFTQVFMENMLGRKIVKIEPPAVSTLSNCSYYFDDTNYAMIVLDYLKIENQKIGQEAMDRKMVKEDQIPMDNFVAYQEDGNINSIYLILGPEKFISLQRSVKAFPDNASFIDFAAKLGGAIKSYK